MADELPLIELSELLVHVDAGRAARGDAGRIQLAHVPDEFTLRLVLRCPQSWCTGWNEALLFLGDARARDELPERVVRLDADGLDCDRCAARRHRIASGAEPGPFGPPPPAPPRRPTLSGLFRTLAFSRAMADVHEAQVQLEAIRPTQGDAFVDALVLQVLDELDGSLAKPAVVNAWRIYAAVRGLVAPVINGTLIPPALLQRHAKRLGLSAPGQAEPETSPAPDPPADPPPSPGPLPPRAAVPTRRRPDFGAAQNAPANPARSQAPEPLVQEVAQEVIVLEAFGVQ